jgi:orotate phosphoribosyltransferase
LSMRQEKEEMKSELCRILTKIGALKFGVFRLTSGKTSPYYVDLRIVPSFPDAYQRICDMYMEMIERHVKTSEFERIAGIPTAGIPFASVIAYRLKKPFLYVRPQKKLHGRERSIEGILMPGDRVLLVDDLITSGGSKLKSIGAIESEGGVVTDVVVLLDREEGGKTLLAKENIALHCLLEMSEVADSLYEMGVITKEHLKTILKQLKK